MKILKEHTIMPIHVTPADTVSLHYKQTLSTTGETIFNEELINAHPEKEDIYDTAVIFQIENELGYAAGIGGMLTRKQK